MKRKAKPAKVRVSIYLDEDVIKFFKRRADRPKAPPYQTQINSELRAVMETGTVPAKLKELLFVRVSQINHCDY